MKIIQYDVELDEENRPYLVKENEFRNKRVSCNSPDAIVELLNSDRYRLNKKSEERVYILGTNNKFTHANIFLLSREIKIVVYVHRSVSIKDCCYLIAHNLQ